MFMVGVKPSFVQLNRVSDTRRVCEANAYPLLYDVAIVTKNIFSVRQDAEHVWRVYET